MKYVIYLRVSTEDQDLRTQQEKCLQFLENHNKGSFDYLLFTDKKSSKKPMERREGLQNALKVLNSGDILVAMRLDRISRKLHETTCLIELLNEKKAEVILVDQPGIKSKVLLGLYAGLAEDEVILLGKRIKEKLDIKKTRNERISGRLPYGYKLDMDNLISIKTRDKKEWTMKPGYLLPDTDEQKVLSLMCQLFDEGKSHRYISRLLIDQGYKNRQGTPFHHMTVYRILARIGKTRSLDPLLEDEDYQLIRSG